MTEREQLLAAKIPCPDTGIEIKHTMCDICTPGPQCGIDAYIKDGVVIKVEGTRGFPSNNGKLCTKGAMNRQYIYRKDRIKTPLLRTGPRGSGQFKPVDWDEAIDYAAEKLNEIKAKYGAESVVWLCGYAKWFRPFLHRVAFSFGSPNYLTESSACHRSEVMSWKSITGVFSRADIPGTKLLVAWGSNPQVNSFPLAKAVIGLKERGGTIIVIDPRNTQAAQKLADIYLRPRVGTDGALAHAMARVIIENGWCDYDFIDKYVHGFEAYKDYVMKFDLNTAEKITGVPGEDIFRVARLFATTDPSVVMPSNSITHRINGYNNHRAIISLNIITGRYDRPGTAFPERDTYCHSDGGFISLEKEFIDAVRPRTSKPAVGTERFPLWKEMVDEGQGMALADQILSGKPYELKAAACFGVNHRMYPDSKRFLEALDKLDFFFATDIFWTDVCNHADLVLPVSTSFERSEIKCYAGRFVNYTSPAIAPVHNNRDDVEIITMLANALDLDDPLLRQGYDACVKYIFSPSGIKDWEGLKKADGPVPAPNAKPYEFGSYLRKGPETPTGKLELYSEVVAKYKDKGLEPLPVYLSSDDDASPEEFPMTLVSGARIPNAIHSRIHDVAWSRTLRPYASLDINPADAGMLGISHGEEVELASKSGAIRVKANVTELANTGEVYMYHGYKEANVNQIIPADHLDPYTGFPGYKQLRCRVSKIKGVTGE